MSASGSLFGLLCRLVHLGHCLWLLVCAGRATAGDGAMSRSHG